MRLNFLGGVLAVLAVAALIVATGVTWLTPR
jgi:hypothetical protein